MSFCALHSFLVICFGRLGFVSCVGSDNVRTNIVCSDSETHSLLQLRNISAHTVLRSNGVSPVSRNTNTSLYKAPQHSAALAPLGVGSQRAAPAASVLNNKTTATTRSTRTSIALVIAAFGKLRAGVVDKEVFPSELGLLAIRSSSQTRLSRVAFGVILGVVVLIAAAVLIVLGRIHVGSYIHKDDVLQQPEAIYGPSGMKDKIWTPDGPKDKDNRKTMSAYVPESAEVWPSVGSSRWTRPPRLDPCGSWSKDTGDFDPLSMPTGEGSVDFYGRPPKGKGKTGF